MAKDKCDRFGNYDADDFECELCEQAEECKKATGTKKPTKKKTEKKAEAAPKKTKKKVKKLTPEQKKAAVKKLSKKKGKKKPVKIKAEKVVDKTKKKVKKALVKPEEKKKVATKAIKAKVEELAVKIDGLKDKTRTAFVNLVMKAAPLMMKAQDLLSVDDFDKWCRERINYERSVCIRYIKAYRTFKEKPELLDSIDGQYKLFAVLAHPTPVKYLEKNQKKIADQTSREFRDNVMKDRADLLGDEDPGRRDPLEMFIKFVKNQTTNLQKRFQDAKKLSKRKSLVLDAGAQEALKLNLEELNEWTSVIKDILKSGRGKK